jgi:long-chain acyl-CoA synthetase
MNHVDVSISPLPSTPSPPTGFVAMFEDNAALRGKDAAVSWVGQGGIHTLNWENYLRRVRTVASAFLALGLDTGDTVAVAASNRVEHLVADWACIHCRAVTVTTYATLAREQLEHVIADCKPRILILENGAMLRKFVDLDWVKDHRPHTVVIDDAGAADLMATVGALSWRALVTMGEQAVEARRDALAARVASIAPGDAATYIYTSGTTGLSKGVTLTHGGLHAEVEAMIRWGGLDYGFKSVSYLPLAHVVERLWSVYLAARTSGHVMCCPDPNRLMDLVRLHRPTFFMAVPRVWEKLRTAFEAALDRLHAAGRGAEVASAREALRLQFDLQQEDAAVPAIVQLNACRAREGVLRDLRTDFGLDKAVMPSCSAAPLRPDVTQFFASLGIDIHQGYGLTETGGPAVADRLGKIRIGSVGMPLPGMEMAVAADGELLIRSPANTPGYRNLPAATHDLYTADGWLRTGDIGRIDDAGRVYITDRKKELIVNSSGKNIAPTAIESRIAGRGFISQAIAHGDGQAFIVALLTVDADKLLAFALARGIHEADLSRLVVDPRVVAEAQLLVDDANAFLSRPEQIKRFRLLPREWRVDDGEVTPTFKLKRRVIHQRHQSELERLHQSDSIAT